MQLPAYVFLFFFGGDLHSTLYTLYYNYSPISFLIRDYKSLLDEWGFCPIRKRE